jgi:hypothetical protein
MIELRWPIVRRSSQCRLQPSATRLWQFQPAQRTAQWRDFAPQTAKLKNSLAPPHLAWRPIVAQELAPQAATSNQIVVPVL